MVNKKKPARTCMACNEQKEKNELLRIVKSKDGIIDVDLTGKKSGRGAYICKSCDCLEKAQKSSALSRSFSCAVSGEVYQELREAVENIEE